MQLFTIGLWELNADGTFKTDEGGAKVPTYDNDDGEATRARERQTHTPSGLARLLQSLRFHCMAGPLHYAVHTPPCSRMLSPQ